ncbi:hypothetical protein JCM11641_006815 [Rhodosporidiobolus odoratus]
MRPSLGTTAPRLARLRSMVYPARSMDELEEAIYECHGALYSAHRLLPGWEKDNLLRWLGRAGELAHDQQQWGYLRAPYRMHCEWWAELQPDDPQREVKIEIKSCQGALVDEIKAVTRSLKRHQATGDMLSKSAAVIESCLTDAPAFLAWLVANGEPLPYEVLRQLLGRCQPIFQDEHPALLHLSHNTIETLECMLSHLNTLTRLGWSRLNTIDLSFGASERQQKDGAQSRQDVVLQQLQPIITSAEERNSLFKEEVERACTVIDDALYPALESHHTPASLSQTAAVFHPGGRALSRYK